MGILLACMSMYHVQAMCPQTHKILGTGAVDSCEQPCEHLEVNWRSLKEQQVFLIIDP